MLVSFFSKPIIRATYACIFDWHTLHASSWSRGPTDVADLAMPHHYHLLDVLLSTLVKILFRLSVIGTKVYRCETYMASSRSLIFNSPPGLSSVINCYEVVLPTDRIHTNHYPYGIRHTPPIPSSDAYVDTFYVIGGWRISRRCIGLYVRYSMR